MTSEWRRRSVGVDDFIWFRIPFTLYWIGRGHGAIAIYTKDWDVEKGNYYWRMI